MSTQTMHKALVLLAAVAGILTMTAAAPPSVIGPFDFSGYNLGPLVSPNGAGAPVAGQNGWSGGSCGLPSTGADEAVVANATFPLAFPLAPTGRSLRFSSAYESGCFDDLFTPLLPVKGGAPGALAWTNGGSMVPCSTSSCQPYFEVSWTVASATGAYQPGLIVDFSPSAGTGARTGQVRMKHTTDAGNKQILRILASDVQGYCRTDTLTGQLFGSCGPPFFTSAPCYQCANFSAYYTVGSSTYSPQGYDPTQPHTIKLAMQMGPGPSSDTVQIYVDGTLAFSGSSWADYYWYDTESARGTPGAQAGRASDTVLIRAGSAPALATLGNGYLFANIKLCSGPTPGACGTTLSPVSAARRSLSSGTVRVQHRQPR